MAGWSSNVYVCVGDVEFWIYIAEYGLVGLDNSLEVDINEEIVRVNVLFDKTFHLQKCWKKVPFVLDMVRYMVATVSMSQIMGNTSLGHFLTQLRKPFRSGSQDRNVILCKSPSSWYVVR